MPRTKRLGSEEGPTGTCPDFNKLTISQLKEQLKEKGLPVSGSKSVLVGRLSDAVSGVTPAKRIKSLAGCPQATFDLVDGVAVRAVLSQHVRTLASMVDDDWHDGWFVRVKGSGAQVGKIKAKKLTAM